MTTSNTTAKKIWNTGYKPGRPRTGELRLVSPNAVSIQEWREKNREKYREYQRAYQAEWVKRNPERAKEIKRATYQRKKALMAAPKLNLL